MDGTPTIHCHFCGKAANFSATRKAGFLTLKDGGKMYVNGHIDCWPKAEQRAA